MSTDILREILTQRIADVEEAKKRAPLAKLQELVAGLPKPLDLEAKIRQSGKMAIMAEVKRASPSKGQIAPPDFSLSKQVERYARSHVAVISVLTEPKWFKGSLEDLTEAKRVVEKVHSNGVRQPAVLRKDFTVDPYQLWEARAAGADSVLLIVAAFTYSPPLPGLDLTALKSLLQLSRELGMVPLVEVANLDEIKIARSIGASVIGINNRNLHNFQVDVETTGRVLADARNEEVMGDLVVGPEVVVCGLSGVTAPHHLQILANAGANAALVGEALMKAPYPEKMIRNLLQLHVPPAAVKICGLQDANTAHRAAEAGADFIGLVFAKSSRKVTVEQAKEIVTSLHAVRHHKGPVQFGKGSDDHTVNGWFADWEYEIRKQLREVKPLIVGVFADQDPEEVNKIAEEVGLDLIQLSGDEPFDSATKHKRPVIKALHVAADDDADKVLSKVSTGQAVALLLDTKSAGAKGGTGQTFDWNIAKAVSDRLPVMLAGGLSMNNVSEAVVTVRPFCIDVSSGVETQSVKDAAKIAAFIDSAKFPFDVEQKRSEAAVVEKERRAVEARVEASGGVAGWFPSNFGPYGGRYVPETLVEPLQQLELAYWQAINDPTFQAQVRQLFSQYIGRPTPLYYAQRLTQHCRQNNPNRGARIWIKREDLCHTGAHKINNAIAQALLAMRLGKKRIIAETGAGQHGVATATACAMLKLECIVYMGSEDVKRQSLNVFRMKLLGAKVVPVEQGSKTLKDAINEAMRDWVTNVSTTHYLVGSAIGPHPFPTIVRDFQSVIGKEARTQILKQVGKLPDAVVSCVGGGSNSIGMFYGFVEDPVTIYGAEAGGEGLHTPKHSSSLAAGTPGVLHGTRTYLIQDTHGQILESHSISAGLDYSGVGPEHAWFKDSKRVEYIPVTDQEVLEAFTTLAANEGILAALESSHAVGAAINLAKSMNYDSDIVINLSGRGDKDMNTIAKSFGVTL